MNKGKKLVLWIGLGCCSLCCLGLMIPIWSMLHGAHDLDKALVVYRAKGLPWTASEVDLDKPGPPEEDAGPKLRQALALIAKSGMTDSSHAMEIIEKDPGGAQAVVDRYVPALKLASEATQLPRANFPKDWDMGPDVLFPELAQTKTLVKLFTIRATLEARHGDSAASNRDLIDAWSISRLMGHEPNMIAMLVQVACRAIVFATAEREITIFKDNPLALQSLGETLKKFTDEPEFSRGVRGEAYMGLALLRNASLFRKRYGPGLSGSDQQQPPLDTRQLVRTGNPKGFAERLLGGKLIEAYVRMHDIAERDAQNLPQLKADLKAVDDEYERDNGPSSFYRNLLAPVYNGVADALCTDRARKLATRALLEGVLKHAEGGAYPKSISEIPGTWIDPYDGKPLRVKVSSDSFRVYSVGPDLVDDGGKARVETTMYSTSYDIVAACPPAAKPVKATKKPPTRRKPT